MKYITLITLALISLLFGHDSTSSNNQMLYLVQSGEVEKGIALYQDNLKTEQDHDLSVLEQLGYILIHQGARNKDEESQLLSMYGLSIVGSPEELRLYEIGITSRNPHIQIATIRFLSTIQDDQVESLLFKAFNSPYLIARLEAAHALSMRRSNQVTGIINALMQKLPPHLHVYFPELFGMIGTSEATGILKQMINNRHLHIRLAAILAAAKFKRDDFLHDIRIATTHADQAEQEACATALGYLKDSHSIPLLKTLTQSEHHNVKLAACHALVMLGEYHFREPIINMALKKNLFAISLLAFIPDTESFLTSLLQDDNFQVQANSALALLRKRDPKCVPVLLKMLINNEKDWGFQPFYSLGNSLVAWKIIPSSTQYAKKMQKDIHSITLALREQILLYALELPEKNFLHIANTIFTHPQNDLIPLLVHLLGNTNTPNAIALLQKESHHTGAPFIRIYCHLALYRMNHENLHRNILCDWVKSQKNHEIFRFRFMLPWTNHIYTQNTAFQLTPEDTSRLLIETLETLAENQDAHYIDMLLTLIRSGNVKNRYALAGLLIKAIQ